MKCGVCGPFRDFPPSVVLTVNDCVAQVGELTDALLIYEEKKNETMPS